MDFSLYPTLLPEKVEWENIEGTIVFFVVLDDELYELETPEVKDLWGMMNGEYSVQDIYEFLLKSYDVKNELLKQDLIQILNDFLSKGIIALRKGPQNA